jgi:hypothetical protein
MPSSPFTQFQNPEQHWLLTHPHTWNVLINARDTDVVAVAAVLQRLMFNERSFTSSFLPVLGKRLDNAVSVQYPPMLALVDATVAVADTLKARCQRARWLLETFANMFKKYAQFEHETGSR